MKKLITIILAAVIFTACAFSFSVSGAEASVKLALSGSTAVSAGDTAVFTLSVKDINVNAADDSYGDGIGGGNIIVKFDTSFFDASTLSVTKPTVSGWDINVNDAYKANGKLVLTLIGEPTQDGIPTVTKNGIFDFKISLKVKSDASESSSAEIYVDGTDADTYVLNGAMDFVGGIEYGSLNVSLIKKLDKPANVMFDNGIAVWDAVEGAGSYVLQLYKDGEPIGKSVIANGTTYDFNAAVKQNLGGTYTVTVAAKSGSELYKDGDSETSSAYKYRGTLSKPSVALTVDKIAGTVKYKITDTNPDDSVSVYLIKVYDKNGAVKQEIASSRLEDTIKSLTFGEKYSVTVEASSSSLTNTETGNLSSGESDKVSVTADGIIGISVSKKPTLSYTEGDSIDLSNMEVTVDFAVAANAKIGRSKFSQYGITVNYKHGADVILSMNGKAITVTCGSLKAKEELVLAVKSGECQHTSTAPEHKDADCGNDGYDREVCSLCGATVTETVLPATGAHDFTEWTWRSKPTVNIDGVRERHCNECGEEEIMQVTYAEYIAMSTTDSTTPPPDTTPDETTDDTKPPVTTDDVRENNAYGGIGDIGKLFLLALIGILVVIVLFIVIAVYTESRRNRRRKSRSRTSQGKNNQYRR